MSQDSLGPALLIAAPQLRDPFFERSVVLLWHHDAEGAIGVIVNRPIPHKLSEVLAQEGPEPVVDDVPAQDESPVYWGGPVETDAGTVVTLGQVAEEEGWQLDCGIGITRSQEALGRLLREEAELLLCLGYAGWGPGQLDQEIEDGGWLITDLDPALLFEEDAASLYERALATLGLTPGMVWSTPISE